MAAILSNNNKRYQKSHKILIIKPKISLRQQNPNQKEKVKRKENLKKMLSGRP
jgi:hypothetical protein